MMLVDSGYWDGEGWHPGKPMRDVDSTSRDSEHKTAEIQADKIVLKVGTLEIFATGSDHAIPFVGTSIMLDGKQFPLTSIKLEADVSGLWRVTVGFFPHDEK